MDKILDFGRSYCAFEVYELNLKPISAFRVLSSARAPYFCSEWLSEERAIISRHDIDLLTFITKVDCVYRAVRTECFNISLSTVFRSLKTLSPSKCMRNKQ